jgi:hypothetical protein
MLCALGSASRALGAHQWRLIVFGALHSGYSARCKVWSTLPEGRKWIDETDHPRWQSAPSPQRAVSPASPQHPAPRRPVK